MLKRVGHFQEKVIPNYLKLTKVIGKFVKAMENSIMKKMKNLNMVERSKLGAG